LEVGSREAREYILERLLGDSMKRVIVDDLVSAHGWPREAAWDEVRLVDEKLSAARAQATYGSDDAAPILGAAPVALLLDAIFNSN
jgi:hypothetical protein